MDRPNIFQYLDLVKFLNDWLTYLRKTKNDFSIRNFSKQTGVAVGYMNMILKRERSLTEKAFLKIAPHLGLLEDEKKFMNLLRVLGLTEEPKLRLDCLNEMMKFKKFRTVNASENRTFDYLTKWHHVAIYEMFNLDGFEMTPENIQKRLKRKLTIADIEQSLEFLKQHQFINENPNGTWTQASPRLDCTEGIYKISLGEFHKQMLELAHESIHRSTRDERFIMGQTMAVNKQDFEKIKQIIQRAVDSINEVNKGSLDKNNVYHIEIAAFPLLTTQLEEPTK
tara:strand:+ start:57342 stop:58184 length:843 start_codon:yes stop_codon:yes gene_type:complete